MPFTLTQITDLTHYFNQVMDRSEHHAPTVAEVSLTILGAVIWKSTGGVKVLARKGNTKNVLWFDVNNRNYVLTYDHGGVIRLLENGLQGILLATFDNTTTPQQIKSVFSRL